MISDDSVLKMYVSIIGSQHVNEFLRQNGSSIVKIEKWNHFGEIKPIVNNLTFIAVALFWTIFNFI